ncbi:riboflavin kinase [Patescibacteria group bacterium]|nr:riboflavin kinase [Patescibacteria group bacterium]
MISFTSRVIKGIGMGRKLGFATINLQIPDNFELDNEGVYSCGVKHKNSLYKGALYYGPRKSLGIEGKTLEIHLLDFDGDLLGEEVRITIGEFIRGAEKFNSTKELIAQIAKDVDMIRG